MLLRGARTAALAAAACAATLATHSSADELPRAEAALLHDLEKVVEASESTGWKVDRYEFERLMPTALESVCGVTERARTALSGELERRIAALGGPVEAAFVKNGRSLDGLEPLLFVTRVRGLLAEAMRRAPAECPFWITPREDFRAIQSDAYRFTLNLEAGGLLVLRHEESGVQPGGGGSGRLLLGRGIDESWTVLAGGEFGGAALFDKIAESTELPISFLVAVPLVLRHHDLTWHYDFELAPIAYFERGDTHPSWGGRAGLLLGISTLRYRGIMPWAGIGAAFEYVFANDVRASSRTVKGGARIGFDWDF